MNWQSITYFLIPQDLLNINKINGFIAKFDVTTISQWTFVGSGWDLGLTDFTFQDIQCSSKILRVTKCFTFLRQKFTNAIKKNPTLSLLESS